MHLILGIEEKLNKMHKKSQIKNKKSNNLVKKDLINLLK
jgi:hypothetical protein